MKKRKVKEGFKMKRLKGHVRVSVSVEQQLEGESGKEMLEKLTSLPKILVEDLGPFLKGQTSHIQINELPSRFRRGVSRELNPGDLILNGNSPTTTIESQEVLQEEIELEKNQFQEEMEEDKGQADQEVRSNFVQVEEDSSSSIDHRFDVEPEEMVTLEEILAEKIRLTDMSFLKISDNNSTTIIKTVAMSSTVQNDMNEAIQAVTNSTTTEAVTNSTTIEAVTNSTTIQAVTNSASRSQQQLKEARQSLAQARIGKSRKMKRRLYYTDARYRKSRKLLQNSGHFSQVSTQIPSKFHEEIDPQEIVPVVPEKIYQDRPEKIEQVGPEIEPYDPETVPIAGSKTVPIGDPKIVPIVDPKTVPIGDPETVPIGGPEEPTDPGTDPAVELPDLNQNIVWPEAKNLTPSPTSQVPTETTQPAVDLSNNEPEKQEEESTKTTSRPKRQIQRPRRLLEAFVTPTIRATKVVKKPLPLLIPISQLNSTLKLENLNSNSQVEDQEKLLEKIENLTSSSASAESSPERPEFSPIKTPVKIEKVRNSPAKVVDSEGLKVADSEGLKVPNLESGLYSESPKKKRRRVPVMASRSKSEKVLCVHENLEIGMFYLIAQEGNRMQVMRFNGTTMEPLDLGWVDTIRATAQESDGLKPQEPNDLDEADQDVKGQDEEAILKADFTAAA